MPIFLRIFAFLKKLSHKPGPVKGFFRTIVGGPTQGKKALYNTSEYTVHGGIIRTLYGIID